MIFYSVSVFRHFILFTLCAQIAQRQNNTAERNGSNISSYNSPTESSVTQIGVTQRDVKGEQTVTALQIMITVTEQESESEKKHGMLKVCLATVIVEDDGIATICL